MKTNKNIKVELHFGITAPRISVQLRKQGRISNNNKDYCHVTEFDCSRLFGSWLQIVCNSPPRKPDCFTVCKKQPHENGLELTSISMDETKAIDCGK